MIRCQIYLTKPQRAQLSKEAKGLGISVSELLRRIIDTYLMGKTAKAPR